MVTTSHGGRTGRPVAPDAAQQQQHATVKIASVAVKAAKEMMGLAAQTKTRSRRSSGPSGSKNNSVGIATSAAASSETEPAGRLRRRRKCRVTVDVTACRYAIILKCLREREFRLVKKSTDQGLLPSKWDIWWSDRGDLLRELPRLSPFQKVNHFPSMEEICRKDFLSNNLYVLPRGVYPRFHNELMISA
jgi:hypothetical protein